MDVPIRNLTVPLSVHLRHSIFRVTCLCLQVDGNIHVGKKFVLFVIVFTTSEFVEVGV
jgi:hypothetical protein